MHFLNEPINVVHVSEFRHALALEGEHPTLSQVTKRRVDTAERRRDRSEKIVLNGLYVQQKMSYPSSFPPVTPYVQCKEGLV